MRSPKLEEQNPSQNTAISFEKPQPVDPSEVLAELFELLEEYAPSWYTEERHDRALSALRILRRA